MLHWIATFMKWLGIVLIVFGWIGALAIFLNRVNIDHPTLKSLAPAAIWVVLGLTTVLMVIFRDEPWR